ncbi:restriction endonuclease [Brevibacillus laterosporus]|nr:BglII/BstYI family type II restriction endonuclease [Brevibacillus laterosporus]TPG83603.1 restriction endonuclease [Brevibacillus laterosporus]
MKVSSIYSFKNGLNIINDKYPELLEEIYQVIGAINAKEHLTKESKEKTMRGRMLYNPSTLNNAFKKEFKKYGWFPLKQFCEYSTEHYTENHQDNEQGIRKSTPPYREMDFVKEKLGIEVQFGKYAFMVYDVCSKMVIFNKLGYIDVGLEIVPIKQFARNMSTGVSYIEQLVWDLENRGESDIDIPVLILGIDV